MRFIKNEVKKRFIKNQEASGLLGRLGIKTPLSQTLLVGLISFLKNKMNKIIHKFSLSRDKFMPDTQN